jgi:hypothetical protein
MPICEWKSLDFSHTFPGRRREKEPAAGVFTIIPANSGQMTEISMRKKSLCRYVDRYVDVLKKR